MIKMNDFSGEPLALRELELVACERVIRSGWWILGDEVRKFEREWKEWLKVAHAVGCGNGLDAIELGLRALAIGPGDEVITTPMTAFATVLAIFRAGAIPVLADVDPDTAMLSPESVRRCITARTKAVLLVHLYGQIGPVDELLAEAQEHGIHLIEDCAQAHGAQWHGKSAGSFGTLATWSFYPTKNLGAVGDGGALTTSKPEVATLVQSLRNYGQTVRYQHPMLGMNSRLDEIQAAILSVRLRHLQEWVDRRRDIAGKYRRGISHGRIRLMPPPATEESHSYHLFVTKSDCRGELQGYLKSKEIESLIHYPIPLHLQEPCRRLARDPNGLRASENHAKSCLSLPCHPGLKDEEIEAVISAINEFPV